MNINVTLVTPCSRPENLLTIYNKINFSLIKEWIIVYDISKGRIYEKKFKDYEKIKEEFHGNEESVVGHSQRNFAINLIENGYIYFIDDDTIPHEGFWEIVKDLNEKNIHDKIVTFDISLHPSVTKGNNIKVDHIDTAQFMFSKSLVLGANVSFDFRKYNGDGIFITNIYKKFKKAHIYYNKVGSYYNYLRQI